MIKPKTLAKPPIKEAVLEILFNYPHTVNPNFLKEYGKLIARDYPSRENLITITGDISKNNAKISRNNIGYAYFSDNKKTSIQTRMNGFSFSQTNESYTSWENFKPIAFKELKAFVDFLKPESIYRLSLRFINEIKVPPQEDLKNYINILPNIDNFDLPIRGFVTRVEVEKPDISAIAIVSQLLSPPFDPTVNIYFDIDVIVKRDPPAEIDFEDLSVRFEKLRDFKNDIFFSSLTEKTINSYC
jgi:uncharacterized protein (TIGR04255 family)